MNPTSPVEQLGFYFTKCEGIDDRYNSDDSTRSLKQILHEDVDDTLESAVHFSFLFDIKWLLEQYHERDRALPMLLVVQGRDQWPRLVEAREELMAQQPMHKNKTLVPIKLAATFGTHHSKMILLKYAKSVRIVVSTANLCERDWSKKSQMVWVSPPLKKVAEGPNKGQDSATGFRSSLCTYLRSYGKEELSDLARSYEEYDFRPIKSYFIASYPKSPDLPASGLESLSLILQENVPEIENECPLIFCYSSIGSLGENANEWFCSVFGERCLLNSTRQGPNEASKQNIQPIFPTVEDVRRSLEGFDAGDSISYSRKTHEKQKWISEWLHHWKADRFGRSRAAPHVKFYMRTSKNYEDTHWFLMSSANPSKAAWGRPAKTSGWIAPLSYECGILHIPAVPIRTDRLVVPFDLPPERYEAKDRVWLSNAVYTATDRRWY